jgi:iron(III) transport system permease protein
VSTPAERLTLPASPRRGGRAARGRRWSWLLVLALATAGLVAVPILSVGSNVFATGQAGTWAHLASTVLPDYIRTTLWLCAGVGIGVTLLGVGSAWLVTRHQFPGRAAFEWALVLPLAVPAYVMAYTYTDFLQFVGPVQTALREAFEWRRGDYYFPDIRTLPGAMLMFSLVLYPYVYLLARTAFLERAGGTLEASRPGHRALAGFLYRVSCPWRARPLPPASPWR